MIASEFFEQGDIEKRQLHIKPTDVMDREKSSQLPRMQIEFIDAVCMPVYKVTQASITNIHIPLRTAGFVKFRQPESES